MEWRGSPERNRDSEQHESRLERNSTTNANFQDNITVLDARSQEIDVLTKDKKSGYKNESDHALEGGEEGRTRMQPCCASSNTDSEKDTTFVLSRVDSRKKCRMIVPFCMTQSSSPHFGRMDALLSDHSQPPVTVVTLQELDLHSIQNNLNLRIDICHDPELYFQPISGQKGYTKKADAQKYWSAIAAEFDIYQHNALTECLLCRNAKSQCTKTFKPRLPVFFDNLRQIVQMLVPDQDHQEVVNHLDTELLMQQVRKGVLDPTRLSSWLASLLTSHCAPMRDCIATVFTSQVQEGVERADMDIFMLGLETLMSMLEAMKLDVANHQIRSFRYPLIEGTVEFQRECFSQAIETQQIDTSSSERWYRLQCFQHKDECRFQEEFEIDQKFECFIHGLVNLCHPLERKVPLTLQYDQHRITRMQEDLQDHIQMNLCLAVFNQQVLDLAGSRCNPTQMHEDLKTRIICLTEDEEGNGGAISDHLDAIGIEITRAADSMRSMNKKQSLTLTNSHFNRTIKLLYDVFQEEDERQTVTKDFLVSLEARTMQFANQFKTMTSLEISNAQKQWARSRSSRDTVLAEWDELARKLAHIGVLHWAVWADICYCIPEEDTESIDQAPRKLMEAQNEILTDIPEKRLSFTSSRSDNCNGFQEKCLIFGHDIAAVDGNGIHVQQKDGILMEYTDDFEGLSGREIKIDLDLDPDLDAG